MMHNSIPYWYFFMTYFIQKYQYIFWYVTSSESCMRARLYNTLSGYYTWRYSLLFILGLRPHYHHHAALGFSDASFYCFLLNYFTGLFEISIPLWTISPNLQLYWTLLSPLTFTKTCLFLGDTAFPAELSQ